MQHKLIHKTGKTTAFWSPFQSLLSILILGVYLGCIPSGIDANFIQLTREIFSRSWKKKNKRKCYFMIIPRNMKKPHLATCCLRVVAICCTVLYNVINSLPLGFVRSLHDVHTEFCKRISSHNHPCFHGITKRTVFSFAFQIAVAAGASFVMYASLINHAPLRMILLL